jgi:hypothetical protein
MAGDDTIRVRPVWRAERAGTPGRVWLISPRGVRMLIWEAEALWLAADLAEAATPETPERVAAGPLTGVMEGE